MCFKAQFEGLVSAFMIRRKKIALVSNIPRCLVFNFKTFTVRKPIFKKKETEKKNRALVFRNCSSSCWVLWQFQHQGRKSACPSLKTGMFLWRPGSHCGFLGTPIIPEMEEAPS